MFSFLEDVPFLYHLTTAIHLSKLSAALLLPGVLPQQLSERLILEEPLALSFSRSHRSLYQGALLGYTLSHKSACPQLTHFLSPQTGPSPQVLEFHEGYDSAKLRNLKSSFSPSYPHPLTKFYQFCFLVSHMSPATRSRHCHGCHFSPCSLHQLLYWSNSPINPLSALPGNSSDPFHSLPRII